MSSGITRPVSGPMGRTDQGVDFSARPGTPVRAIARSRQIGVIQDWYKGQPYAWFKIISGPFKGLYWFAAEQIRFRTHPGQTVEQGQVIGTVPSSGTGQEFGLATPSGRTLAKATTGYTEGQATPAGKRFRAMLLGATTGGGVAAAAATEKFTSTAYGPPWGGIQGGGTTATGINLSHAPHRHIVAVDPTVIPLHSKLRIWPNPFSNKPITFAAEDTGGAIKGNHIDFYDWRGRKTQNAWGTRTVNVEVLGDKAGSTFGRTRPGGESGGSSDAALEAAFAFDFADDASGTGAATPGVSGSGQGGMENVTFPLPGLPGIPGIPGIPLPSIPNPLDLFKTTKDAINGVGDFLKWISWLFHPRNILRVVEFLTGLVIMGFGVHTAIEAHKGSRGGETTAERGKRAAKQVFNATPAGRYVRVARGARAGKTAVRAERRREEFNDARKRGRTQERQRGKTQKAERNTRKKYGDDVPF